MMQKLSFDIYLNDNQVVQDAYDILIANLHDSKNYKLPKTICVTGCAPKVGTTTVALNLAVSLAMAKWKVLFVDADIRKPREAKRLGQAAFIGLSDFLTEQLTLTDILCSTNLENLYYITCGDTDNINVIGLLCSHRFSELLEQISVNFDVIILDSPSLSSAGDAQVIAAQTESTLLVALTAKTRRDELNRISEKLSESGANITAVILNRAKKDLYKNHLNAYNYFSETVKKDTQKNKKKLKNKAKA